VSAEVPPTQRRSEPRLRGKHPVPGILQPMHLFAAFLGGPVEDGRMGEDHEVVFVVASDINEAKGLAKSKWSGVGRGHVDAVQRVDQIDGYEVTLSQVADSGGGDLTELQGYN
jgi:hypothetical protein